MSNYDKATRAIIDGDGPLGRTRPNHAGDCAFGLVQQVPESARWHMRHRVREYERLVKQAREGEKGE